MRPLLPRFVCAFFVVIGALHAADGGGASRVISPMDSLVYVGTYTNGKSTSKGIYAFRFEPARGTLTELGLAAKSTDPAFLAVDAQRRLVFAVNEIDNFAGGKTGSVSAFRINPKTGLLDLINQQPSGGAGPCHLALAPDGRHLVIANYSGGTVAVIRVAEDGRLDAPSTVIRHEGHSVNPDRQEAPHPHCVTFDPAGRFVFICDLGIDRVMAYKFDAAAGTLAPAETPYAKLAAGAGPRHLAFRPDGKFAYVLNELHSTVTAFRYDARSGRLTEIQTLSSLPPDFRGTKSGAEITVHPSGRWLYASNRGRDSIAVFSIDAETGSLAYRGDENTGGKTPRHFGVAPGGLQLIACNQDSSNLVGYSIDPADGHLARTATAITVSMPVCVVFVPPAAAK